MIINIFKQPKWADLVLVWRFNHNTRDTDAIMCCKVEEANPGDIPQSYLLILKYCDKRVGISQEYSAL